MLKHRRPLGSARAWATGSALCLLIVGCATPSQSPAPAGDTEKAAPAQETPKPVASRRLPDVELTGPLLFVIVAAEVAVQRGEPSAAFATLMKAARETRDPRLARRATEVALGARAAPQALESAQLWRELDGGSSEAEQTYT
jgi:hypothetical protein